MLGERLSQLVSFESLKLAAATVLLAPFIPLLFMGEEYGETAPFQYFTSHSDPALVEAVRRGRREEFVAFRWQGDVPDPDDEATFRRSRLCPELLQQERHRVLWNLYRELIRARKELPALANLSKEHLEVAADEKGKALFLRRWADAGEVFALFNFAASETTVVVPVSAGYWQKRLDSADTRWLGDGSRAPDRLVSPGEVRQILRPRSFALFVRTEDHGT